MTIGKHEKPNQGETDIWLTPPDIIEALGPFDLDPCAAPCPRPWDTASTHYAEASTDGLTREWFGSVWLNPPYGNKAEGWLAKLAEHGEGIALVFARTETAWFQRMIKSADWLLFFPEGRLVFHRPNGDKAPGSAGAPSVFMAIGAKSKLKLREFGRSGFYCEPQFNREPPRARTFGGES